MTSTVHSTRTNHSDLWATLSRDTFSQSGGGVVRNETERHASVEKIDAFVTVLLSEQLGPLTYLQRDVLETIQSAITRIIESETRATPEGLVVSDQSFPPV